MLTDDVWPAMLAQGIDRAMEGHRYRLAAFVFVPEHVHLMIYLHHNPVRGGLVKRAVDWKWSSARYGLLDPPRQYAALPTIDGLPAEWLDATD